MNSIHQEILVAENCMEYKPKKFTTTISCISSGCSSCISYISGKCTKDLFEEIEEMIKIN